MEEYFETEAFMAHLHSICLISCVLLQLLQRPSDLSVFIIALKNMF